MLVCLLALSSLGRSDMEPPDASADCDTSDGVAWPCPRPKQQPCETYQICNKHLECLRTEILPNFKPSKLDQFGASRDEFRLKRSVLTPRIRCKHKISCDGVKSTCSTSSSKTDMSENKYNKLAETAQMLAAYGSDEFLTDLMTIPMPLKIHETDKIQTSSKHFKFPPISTGSDYLTTAYACFAIFSAHVNECRYSGLLHHLYLSDNFSSEPDAFSLYSSMFRSLRCPFWAHNTEYICFGVHKLGICATFEEDPLCNGPMKPFIKKTDHPDSFQIGNSQHHQWLSENQVSDHITYGYNNQCPFPALPDSPRSKPSQPFPKPSLLFPALNHAVESRSAIGGHPEKEDTLGGHLEILWNHLDFWCWCLWMWFRVNRCRSFLSASFSFSSFAKHAHMFARLIVLLTILFLVSPVSAMNDEPNVRANYDVLPGLTVWNGLPMLDFVDTWYRCLTTALGQIVQDGFTLWQTARAQDPPGDAVAHKTMSGCDTTFETIVWPLVFSNILIPNPTFITSLKPFAQVMDLR